MGSSCNAISVGWHAVGRDGFEDVLETSDLRHLRSGFIRANGSEDDAYITEEAVFKWLQLAEQHFYKQNMHKDFREASLSFEEVHKHEEATHCYVCCMPFSVNRKKAHDRCHGTSKYRGPACDVCNGKMKQPKEVVVIAHNMSRFDGHLILQAISVLKNDERWRETEILGKPLHE